MVDTLIYIPNDETQNYPIRRLKLVVETSEKLTEWTNQSKIIEVAGATKPTNKQML